MPYPYLQLPCPVARGIIPCHHNSASSLSFAANSALMYSASLCSAALFSAFEVALSLVALPGDDTGDRNELRGGSAPLSEVPGPPVGFKMDFMDDRRFDDSCSAFCGISMSVEENDRLRDGERNEAGDSDDCLSLVAAIDVNGASRFSFVNEDATWYCVKSDPGRSGEACRVRCNTSSGTRLIDCSGFGLAPRLTDPSGFIEPFSRGVSGPGDGDTDASLASSGLWPAGKTRFRRLIIAFFIVTGLWTLWSL